MPLTQKKRHNRLMLACMERLKKRGHTSGYLAGVFEVSHSQMYMARERSVGPDNGEKIASGMQVLLGLSKQETLALKAEITNRPLLKPKRSPALRPERNHLADLDFGKIVGV